MLSISNFKLKIQIILLLFLVNLATSFECPEYCECSVSYKINTNEVHNLAKCRNMTGLKGSTIGKKSPINSIDLSDLNLSRMTTSLENFKNLTDLNLSNNKLFEINKLNKRIVNLNLSYNKLGSSKISKVPQYVEHLDLSHNQLTHIPRDLMRLTRLKKLELTGNPINCNCETIEVRNWLQEHHVWSDRHVKCASPIQYRERSWLQVKQTDVCDKVKTKSGYIWSTSTDEDDDLMFADSPVIDDGGSGEHLIDDEIDYMPVSKKLGSIPAVGLDYDGSTFDGSGFGVISKISSIVSKHLNIIDEQDENGSGSGSGIFPIIIDSNSSAPRLFEDDNNSTYVYESPGIFVHEVTEKTLFGGRIKTVDSAPKPKEDVENVEGIPPTSDIKQGSILATGDPTDKNKDDENQGVYILLAVIAILFVSLLVFVAFKRSRKPASKRTYDPEAASNRGTELKPMDKNNLGKPSEFMPLMGEKPVEKPVNAVDAPKLNSFKPIKSDEDVIRKPLLDQEKPLQNGQQKSPSKASLYENENPENNNIQTTPNENHDSPTIENNDVERSPTPPVPASRTHIPIVPVHQTPEKTPNGVHHPNIEPNNNNTSDDEVFHPAESPEESQHEPAANHEKPKSPLLNPSRYSPVYSPETGRVKVKLTTTPKPKTPLLVNRSRSNAGDIILTTSPELSRK